MADNTTDITIIDNTTTINTFDLTDVKSKMQVLNGLNSADSLNDMPIDTIFEVTNIVMQPGIRNGRNGAPKSACINTIIFCKDGNSYFTQSDGIARSLYPIADLFWDNGKLDAAFADNGFIPIQINVKKLPNGNTLKTARIVM